MNNKNNVLLINPPLWYYQSIPPDTLYAANSLCNFNIDFEIYDYNLDSIEYFLKKSSSGKDILNKLVTNEEFYDTETFLKINNEIPNVFKKLSDKYYPTQLTLSSFMSEIDERNLDDVIELANDKVNNPYICFFESKIEQIINLNPKIIAISIFHPDQIIPVFTLLKILKENIKDIHLTLFGNLEDQINTKILFRNVSTNKIQRIFGYIDSVFIGALGDGLPQLYTSLNEGSDYQSIPNLLTGMNYQNFVEIKSTITDFKLNENILRKLPRTKLMPKTVINLCSSVGCYWGRCNFCSIKNHAGLYIKDKFENTIENLKLLENDLNVDVVRFRDCAISPQDLNILATRIIEENIVINWSCRARFDDGYNKELIKLLQKAGCIFISFGIESFHPSVNNRMNKNTCLEDCYQIIKWASEEGIAIKLTAMIGFPTESYDEIIHNQNCLLELLPYLIDIQYNDFMLFEGTTIAENPDKFDIEIKPFEDNHFFRHQLDYSIKSGIPITNIIKEQKKFNDKIKVLPSFVSEEHLLLFLSKYGLNDFKKIFIAKNVESLEVKC